MKLAMFAALAAMTFAAPAMANDFTGIHAAATVGFNDVTHGVDTTDVVYGAEVGADAALYKNVIIGISGYSANVFDRANLGVNARLGVVVAKPVLLYTTVGYSNWKETTSEHLDGLNVGGGVEYKLFGPFYTGVEYTHGFYTGSVGTNGVKGKVGVRF
jgi:hypothetical protein